MDLMYLDNLEEFINDENKIVTYRWLSLTLNVSSNTAKQMLFHYYDKANNSNKECNLSATYLLSGLQYDDELKQDVHKISIVKDHEVEKQKNKFKVIYSLHIYSLQKVKLKDLHILYGIDYDKIKEDVFKSAKYSSISPASGLRSNVQSKYQSPRKLSPKKSMGTNKMKENESVDNKENKLKDNGISQKNPSKTAKTSLESMFANQVKKPELKKPLEAKQETNLKLSSKNSSNGVKKKGALDAYFSKGPKPQSPSEGVRRSPRKLPDNKMEVDINEKSPRKSQDKEIEVKSKEERISPRKKQDDKSKSVIQKKINSNNSQLKSEVKTETRSSPRSKDKSTKGQGKSPIQKGKRKSTSRDLNSTKRQRIMTLADSSSSESENEEEEEDLFYESPVPPSPPTKTIKSDEDDESPLPPSLKPVISQKAKSQGNKRKKRKQVDKTYEDDKGFLVTIKDYEFVTDSDDEDPIPSSIALKSSHGATSSSSPKKKASPRKKSPTKGSPQKKSKRSPQKKSRKSPVKGKQASITSFFKAKN